MNPAPIQSWQEELCCPACHARLTWDDRTITCSGGCAARLKWVDGIPVLIDEARSVFSPDAIRSAADPMAKKSRPKQALQIYERRSADNLARAMELARAERGNPAVLIIGGGQRGPAVQALYDDPNLRLLATDVYIGPCTQVVCDGHALPFRDGCFDVVVIQAVLEHVLDPVRCVAEIHRVIREGGLVYAESPFIQQVHMGAYDFTRWTHAGHRRLFRMFDEIDSGLSAGPGYALAWTLTYFLTSFSEREGLRRLLARVGGLLGAPLKFLDRFLMDKRGAMDGASGCYFLGRRRNDPVPDQQIIAAYRGQN